MSVKSKVEQARAAINHAGFAKAKDSPNEARVALIRMIAAGRHFADAYDINYMDCANQALKIYQGDTNSMKYKGWDRRHDDNKAEGRPVGNQWSDDGVYYVQGVKMHGPKRRP